MPRAPGAVPSRMPARSPGWTLPCFLHEVRGILQGAWRGLEEEKTVSNSSRGLMLRRTLEQLQDLCQSAEGASHKQLARAAEVVRDQVEAGHRQHPGTLIEFKADPSTECIGTFDVTALRQSTSNLIGNALRYAAQRPIRIQLGLERGRQGQSLLLRVEDDGPGMRPAERKRAFRRGWRGKEAGRNHPEGKGLGLSIVHELVRDAGGEVSVAAARSGGCDFQVRLPWVPDKARAESLRGRRIAVVDDHPVGRSVAAGQLRMLGAQTRESAGRGNLRRWLEREGCDAVVLDVRLGKADGRRLARTLRDDGWLGGIVLWSGLVETRVESADAYLRKPADRTQLVAAVRQALDAAEDRKLARRRLMPGLASEIGLLEEALEAGLPELEDAAHRTGGALSLAGWPLAGLLARRIERAAAGGQGPRARLLTRKLIADLRERSGNAG